jgi:hypothetical protein
LFDSDNSRHISRSYTINSSGTWEQKTITFPGDTTGSLDNDNGSSLTVRWWLAAGTDWSSGTLATSWQAQNNTDRAVGQVNLADSTANEWQITGVQLEVGSVATPFEHRSFGDELLRCQRYFSKSYGHQDAPGVDTSDSLQGLRNWDNTGRSDLPANVRFPVEMRAAPAVTIYTKSGIINTLSQSTDGFSHAGSRGVSAVRSVGRAGYNTLSLSVNIDGLQFYIWHWTASAEL